MATGCPGSDLIKNPYPEEIRCPYCKAEIEIWSDETRARCRNCHHVVTREMGLSCIDWCPKAKECLGPDRLEEIIRERKAAGS